MIQIWKSSLPGMEPESGHSLLIGDVCSVTLLLSLFFPLSNRLSYHLFISMQEATVIIGMSGSVAALDKASGRMEWRVSLPGWYALFFVFLFFLSPFPLPLFSFLFFLLTSFLKFLFRSISKTLVTVAATANPNMLVCGTVGRLYGIDKRGRVLWQDSMNTSLSPLLLLILFLFCEDKRGNKANHSS